MASAFADIKHEWRQFRDDEPGERFHNHHRRMLKKSKKHAAVTIALGVLLLVGGFVFLFIPGPGLPLIVFGVALIGTHSKRISDRLDRAEPRVRDAARRALAWWKRLPVAGKAALVTSVILVASVGLLAMWRWVVSAYLV